jgi:hypothetical protein
MATHVDAPALPLAPFVVIGSAVWHWPPATPPLLIAALQHDQDACKLRIQIARHNASRRRPLGASQFAFSSGAFAGAGERP